ncbi:MAG: ATP-grasp domain-containing protein [Candidatus Hydrothermarchaeaceae archaeon]
MKLLLCAASARAMAESASRADYDFVALDFFGDVDTKKTCENYSLREFGDGYSTENLYNRSTQLDFTHVVYGAGFENHSEFVEGFEKRAVVTGNDSKTLRRVRDWKNFFSTLEREGIAFPKTEIVRAGDVNVHDLGGMILKPAKSGGGHRIDDISRTLSSTDEEVLLQDVISGTPVSTCIVGTGKKCRFLGATEQIISDSYRYHGNIAPLKTTKALEDISVRIGEMFGLRGVNGIDFILSADCAYVLEVNPRLTGAMEVLEKAYGVNLFDIHVKACAGTLDFKPVKTGRYYCRKILYAAESHRFNLKRLPAFIKDVPADEYIREMGPICTIIGEGETPDACREDMIQKEKIYEDLRQKNLRR